MASALAEAHIEGQARLRGLTSDTLAAIWASLSGYDRDNIPEWLANAVPTVLTAQRASVALTNAYLAAARERQPLPISTERLIGAAVRQGVSPQEVYQRPFVTLWTGLKDGKPFEEASAAALARAQGAAAADVQLAMRATAGAVEKADPGIYGYQRVADGGACSFCLEVNGAFVKSASAFPLHNNCGCGLEPLTSERSSTPLPETVAVHEHGELGAVLADPAHDFTTAAQALA